MALSEHPTVKKFYHGNGTTPAETGSIKLKAEALRQLCLDAGAGDIGFVEIGRPEISNQKAEILAVFPSTRFLISIVCKMNRENIRTPARSVANLEFHHTTDEVNEVARRIVQKLESACIRAMNGGAAGFPMEADRWGAKMWLISHKPVAVAAGMGQMGIHRNVIHPRFGNFILLGTVLVDAELDTFSQPLDYNPCLSCKLCVAACPTGAIGADGHFNFSACYTHNYREFMGGFNDWVGKVVESKTTQDYRQKVSDAETVSMWQSLSFGANYKAAYCLAVCPAGEDVIAPFLTSRKEFVESVLKPLQEKPEIIYVVPGSDAEEYTGKHFPNKKVKRVGNGLSGQTSVEEFLRGLPLVFQRGRAQGIDATYHWTFTGKEERKATVIIRHQEFQAKDGHQGLADVHVTVDSATWLRLLRKESSIIWAVVRRKIRIRGRLKLLLAFGRCFPS
ncbi:MAG: SCP2 sterol-binding domain-containing protein [Nitrospirae bacterium]|nr:SCP2 sterol-binding domain-containing protein [Nitrospirota bacterium]MBI3594105.1 SCP2 sterol-binding domain-containing protein [Nitrospirota bacterium]